MKLWVIYRAQGGRTYEEEMGDKTFLKLTRANGFALYSSCKEVEARSFYPECGTLVILISL